MKANLFIPVAPKDLYLILQVDALIESKYKHLMLFPFAKNTLQLVLRKKFPIYLLKGSDGSLITKWFEDMKPYINEVLFNIHSVENELRETNNTVSKEVEQMLIEIAINEGIVGKRIDYSILSLIRVHAFVHQTITATLTQSRENISKNRD